MRRVVVGLDVEGRSTVVRSDSSLARVERPSGAVVEELWRVEHLPAGRSDDGSSAGEMASSPPPGGLSWRAFTIPPAAGEGVALTLSGSSDLFLLTVVSGAAVLVLESGAVALDRGDAVVLPGHMHAWRNPHAVDCVIVTTVVRLSH